MDRTAIAKELVVVAKDLVGIDFPTQDAMDKYLKDHPDADRSNHKVVETKKEEAPAKKDDKSSKKLHHQTTVSVETIESLGWTGTGKKIDPDTAEGMGKVKKVLENGGIGSDPAKVKEFTQRLFKNHMDIHDSVEKFTKEKYGLEHVKEGSADWKSMSAEDQKSVKYFRELSERAAHASYVVGAYMRSLHDSKKSSMVAAELVVVAKDLVGIDFPTQDSFDKYMKEHPDADKSNHRVVETKEAPAKKDEAEKPRDSRSLSEGYIKRRKEIFKKDSGISHEEYEKVEGKVKALAHKDDANYAKYEPLVDSAWKGYFKTGEKQLLDAANGLVDEGHLSKEEVGHILTRGLSEAKANVESWESGNNLFGLKKDAPKYDQYTENAKNHLKDWKGLIKKFKGGKAEAEKKSSVAAELVALVKDLTAGRDTVSVDELMKYEDGQMTEDEVIELFQKLVNNGMAWQLQGAYGRMAQQLIQQGLIHRR